MVGRRIELQNRYAPKRIASKLSCSSFVPKTRKNRFDIVVVSPLSSPKTTTAAKSKTRGIRAVVRTKPKKIIGEGNVYRASRKPLNGREERFSRQILSPTRIFYPASMNNFDRERPEEFIISECEAKEIAHQLSSSGHTNPRAKTIRKQQQVDLEDMEETALSYLRTTYTQLHEKQVQKLNDVFALTNDDKEESATTAKRSKRKLNASMDVEEESFSSENSSYEISKLTRDLRNGMQLDKETRTKPTIIFTPVNSADEEKAEADDCGIVSPFYDRRVSGSSSPLLEVPVCGFRDLTAEMMRPPLN